MAETVTAKKVTPKSKTKGKNNKKIIIIGGVALLVVGASVGAYFLYKRKKETGSYFGGSSTSGSGGTRKSSGFSCTSNDYPLSYGTCHPDVGILQKYLKQVYKADLGAYGKNKDGIDNKFGKVTKDAAMKHLKKSSFTQKDITGMKSALKFIVK